MEKIYGYKEKDVIGLANFLNQKENLTLTEIFEKYSAYSGKSKGTVRNLYYALAKASVKDTEIRDKYLGGRVLEVSPILTFDKTEERELIKNIFIGKSQGKSVRSVINQMANGDSKLALRYQNKFRGALKNNPVLIDQVITEVNATLVGNSKPLETVTQKTPKEVFGEMQFNRLKTEINLLVNKISQKEKRENAWLKDRVASLEMENIRLKTVLYGSPRGSALDYFSSNRKNGKNGENTIH